MDFNLLTRLIHTFFYLFSPSVVGWMYVCVKDKSIFMVNFFPVWHLTDDTLLTVNERKTNSTICNLFYTCVIRIRIRKLNVAIILSMFCIPNTFLSMTKKISNKAMYVLRCILICDFILRIRFICVPTDTESHICCLCDAAKSNYQKRKKWVLTLL